MSGTARWLPLAAALAALVLPGAAGAGLIVGVNDDAAKDASEVGWFYPTMGSEGLQLSAITLRWDETAPTTVPDETAVSRAISAAKANGQTVELALYPLHSMVFTGGTKCMPVERPAGVRLDDADPGVRGLDRPGRAPLPDRPPVRRHERVQPAALRQPAVRHVGRRTSRQRSAAVRSPPPTTSSRAVSSQSFVWGVGLSPRGNDNANAASNVSTSPVAFLRALGAWFKASGRTRPMMDGLDFHPYPIPQSLPFAQGYPDVRSASVSNLPRIYQAFYDGFNGSAQLDDRTAGGWRAAALAERGRHPDRFEREAWLRRRREQRPTPRAE